MGFFDKLFWGGSRRFANDGTNNMSKAKEQKVRSKVETFNAISKDFCERKNFVDDSKTLMADVVNCFTEEEPDNEKEKVLLKRMTDYYQAGKRKIEEKGTVAVPQYVVDIYSNMLKEYNQVLAYIEKFIKQRQWARSPEQDEYKQQTRELRIKRMYNEITQEELSKSLKSLKTPPSPLEGTGEDLITVIRKSNEYQHAFAKIGESMLNKLK
jgi:hypothetical protein